MRRLADHLARAEHAVAGACLLAIAVLPVLEIALRALFHTGIPGAAGYVQNLTLWSALAGAVVAVRQRRHLALATGALISATRLARYANGVAAAASAAVAAGLAWAALDFVRAELDSAVDIAGWLPIWAAEAVLPLAFAAMATRFIVAAGGLTERVIALSGLPAVAAAGLALPVAPDAVSALAFAALAVATLLGAPIFVALGAVALVLFSTAGVPVAALSVETYRLVMSPSIPTIALFTLTGYVLAESGASRRLVRLFNALFGWVPGGLAIVTTLVCAFFTTFTGATGVTIVALGGVLLPVLLKGGYREPFAIGLLTATGSIGILFPPSLAVILYGVVAKVSILDVFTAVLLPGLVLVAAVCAYGAFEGVRAKASHPRFDACEALAALGAAKWEVMVPVVVLVAIFGGFATLTEAAAVSVVFTVFVETVVHRDIHPLRELPGILTRSATLLGAIFVILGVSVGLTNYLVDADVPTRAAEWVRDRIDSRFAFLLALNAILLVVGCLMDIFSAIVLVVPLLLPIAEAFGIHPLHFAVIFLLNLELGYLTPPVGMNLFLASVRFNRPLAEVCRDAAPFLLLLLAVVLVATYVPALTLGADGGP